VTLFALEEAGSWTADDVFERLGLVLPSGWRCEKTAEGEWHRIALLDAEGVQQWSGEHVDLRLLGLDALGWLRLRGHQVRNPAWRPRVEEVPLQRPPMPLISVASDPADLDPDEVGAVYKTSR
jgi:hypothetical protein